MKIYCCGCNKKVEARLTNGGEVYPHRSDLYNLSFWICDDCGNFVGCHNKNKGNPNQPLGCIPTQEIKNYRIKIHSTIDPLWKSKIISRKALYSTISNLIGWEYHTAKIRSVQEAKQVLSIARRLKGEIN